MKQLISVFCEFFTVIGNAAFSALEAARGDINFYPQGVFLMLVF